VAIPSTEPKKVEVEFTRENKVDDLWTIFSLLSSTERVVFWQELNTRWLCLEFATKMNEKLV